MQASCCANRLQHEPKLLSIDLAKTVFQLCGMDTNHPIFFNKKISRKNLVQSVLQIKPDTIVMESCYSANYWGREFQKLGFKVKLMPPQHVKPFVKGNKNDHYKLMPLLSTQCLFPISSVQNWNLTLSQLAICFEDRLTQHLDL